MNISLHQIKEIHVGRVNLQPEHDFTTRDIFIILDDGECFDLTLFSHAGGNALEFVEHESHTIPYEVKTNAE